MQVPGTWDLVSHHSSVHLVRRTLATDFIVGVRCCCIHSLFNLHRFDHIKGTKFDAHQPKFVSIRRSTMLAWNFLIRIWLHIDHRIIATIESKQTTHFRVRVKCEIFAFVCYKLNRLQWQLKTKCHILVSKRFHHASKPFTTVRRSLNASINARIENVSLFGSPCVAHWCPLMHAHHARVRRITSALER